MDEENLKIKISFNVGETKVRQFKQRVFIMLLQPIILWKYS